MCLPFIPWSNAGVPSSQALPGYLITAPPSVCVPAVLGALAVWIQNQNTKNGTSQDTRKEGETKSGNPQDTEKEGKKKMT